MGQILTVHINKMFPGNDPIAAEQLPAGLSTAFFGHNPLFMSLIIPGTADDTGKRLLAMQAGDMKSVRRAQILYRAWLAFYRGKFTKAEDGAVYLFQNIKDGEIALEIERDDGAFHACSQKLGAAFLLCNLARHGRRQNLVDKAVIFMGRLRGYRFRLAQTAEILLALYEMSVGILSDVPEWIRTGDYGVSRVEDHLVFNENSVHPENLYTAVCATAEYAIHTGDFHSSLALINTAERVYGLKGFLIGDVQLAMYRAMNYEAIGFFEAAQACLEKVLQMIEPDALWQIISVICTMLERLYITMKEEATEVSSSCVDITEGIIARFKDIRRKDKEQRECKQLTYHELEVLRLVVKRFNTARIAKALNTEQTIVRHHKKSAFLKLGIESDAEAAELLQKYEVSMASMI